MDLRRSHPRIAALATGTLLIWAGLGSVSAWAQGARPKQGDVIALPAVDKSTDAKEKEAAGQNVFARPDRLSVQRLTKAEQLIQQGRYAEAVRNLGTILEATEDFFLPGDASVRRSLRVEAQALLGRTPRAGRELYELEYGARARQMLNEAAAAGDPAGLAEVSRRFFHTRAGYEATLLLGLYHLDHTSPVAGAMTLQRLQEIPSADDFEPALSLSLATCWLRAGERGKAEQTLTRLKNRHSGATVQIGGKPIALFSDDSRAVDWLTKLTGIQTKATAGQNRDWAMVGGDATRNAAVLGSGPLLSLRWRVSSSDDPYMEAMIDQLSQSSREREQLTVPSAQPLVVGGLVLMRTAKNLLAVDFRTGKQVWEVPVDDPFESVRVSSPDLPMVQPFALGNALKSRIWEDATFGTMSSDGQRVFAIEDLPLETGMSMNRQFFNVPMPRGMTGPRPYNRLAAFNVRTGKLEWHLGGSPEEFGLPQAGTFFLGPPLALMDRLYAIAESKGEIRLLALDAKGNVTWTQQLGVADREVLNDPIRRLAGVSPCYADGVLVCPTAGKSLVAMELATRSLLWGYTYADKVEATSSQRVFLGLGGGMDVNPKSRWPVAGAVVAEGCVLATPADSGRLHCLNLVDGKFLWAEPRDEDLYLACVHQGKAILVGQRRVRALELKTGKPVWEHGVEFPTGSSPTGIGFLSGDLYYVPLSSAEVMAIDLKQGRAAHVTKSRQGNVPGNLVCCGVMVVSQRPQGVEVFSQIEALRKQVAERLAADPKDAESLTLRGEIHWDEGRLPEAIADLRRALGISSDPKTRGLLRDAMFEGLRTNFAEHRKALEEIEGLIDEPGQRAKLLGLLAMGCENAGEYRHAFGHYLKLVDLDRERRDMEVVDQFLSVRRDRWLQVRLAALHEAAPPDVKAEIDQEVQRRQKAAADEKTSDALARFLDYFGSLPACEEARSQWIAHLRRSGRFLQAEQVLLQQARSRDPRQAGGALAQLAAMLADAERFQDAALMYRRLEAEFADVECLNGKTGRQLVEAVPAGGPVRRLLDPKSPWPAGEVLVERSKGQRRPLEHPYSRGTLEFVGNPGPFFSDLTLEWQQNPAQIVARDGLGERRWQLSLAETTHRGQVNFGLMRASARGHLLLLAVNQSIMAVDTLGSSVSSPPRLLWSHDQNDSLTGVAARQQARVQVANLVVGAQRDPFGLGFRYGARPAVNLPGVINEHLACFLRFRSCVALHPLTGDTLWVRQDIRPDSTIFGDEQYVFVVPPDQSPAMVLQASDGKLLGQRQVPTERIAVFGRYVLVWRDSDKEAVLELIDPWDEHKVWGSRTFAAHAKYSIVDNELVAVFEPGGRFVLLEAASGRVHVDAKLQPESVLADIFVLRSPDGYVLVTSGAESDDQTGRRIYPLQYSVPGAQVARGLVYGFDRQGKPLWSNPVKVAEQYLLLSQPKRLPVVMFGCQSQIRRPNGDNQQRTSILCIDRQTGRVLVRQEFPSSASTFQLTGQPEQKTVQLQWQQETLTMTFTGKPITAQSPPEGTIRDDAAEAAKKAKPRGLFDALQRATKDALGKTFGAPREDEDSPQEKPQRVEPQKKPSEPRKEEKKRAEGNHGK